jgi:4-hydroxybenzoate polyprenyltransferase
MRSRRNAGAIAVVHAAHPLPSAAVTGAAVVLGLSAGNSAAACVMIGLAVLAGQLSVGWSNDWLDAERDRAVGHRGKPLANGATSRGMIRTAAAVAAGATIGLSLVLGWRAGGLHIAAVAAAWLYNSWLKRTWLSWLPYAFAFGALPAVATFTLATHPAPAAWAIAATALIGIAVNFVNAVPALAEHPASDVCGLPDRLGGRLSLLAAAALLTASGAVVGLYPAEAPTAISWLELTLTLLGGTVGTALFWGDAETRRPFYGLLALAAVQLLAAAITGHPLY